MKVNSVFNINQNFEDISIVIKMDSIIEKEKECQVLFALEYERLKRENLYLRKLLNIDEKQTIIFPEEDKSNLTTEIHIIKDETTEGENNLKSSSNNNLTVSEKIYLFRRLFRGREDVYALRWQNKKGKAGYSPACANEWDRRVCRKPKIKCSECQFSKWLPITDKEIYHHLAGDHMIGVYPLQKNETCHFLAIDFDKESWKEDALAFFKTCQDFKLPVALERSQSGHGAHIWIFFSDPVSARFARLLGTGLLTHTMKTNPGIGLDSYDRLFPNQDTLPKGGFGNLIALPLQGNRRKAGNSIFLDEKLEPYSDPWMFLSSINPINEYEVLALIEKLNQQGGILDILTSSPEEEQEDSWVTPKQIATFPKIEEPLPEHLELIMSNLLYVPHLNLPTLLINQIKKIAAFQNPEFYKAQAMRLSTYGKPRVISCSEEFPKYIGLPRGCEKTLLELLKQYNIKTTTRFEVQDGDPIDFDFHGDLTPDQSKALKAILPNNFGILAAATGFGKTVIAAKIISERKTNTLILVHRQQLLEQWIERLCLFLNLSPKSIGVIGGGRKKVTGVLDMAMLQSLHKKEGVLEEITQYGQVIVDECHHLAAVGFERVLKKAKARYVLGLTATPTRKDGHHPIILMQCGPIRFRVSSKSQIIATQMKHNVQIRNTTFELPNDNIKKMSDIYAFLVNDDERNTLIFEDVLEALKKGRTPLLLTERTKHLEWFSERFKDKIEHVFVLRGGMKHSRRNEIFQEILNTPNDKKRLILATGSYIGEGFDDPRLDTLFLSLPISWQGTLQQYVGRLHRTHEQKQDIIVNDYVDQRVPLLNKMFQKRLKKYRAMGYIINGIKI
jgi:superfamily II DNA or RNA helicase